VAVVVTPNNEHLVIVIDDDPRNADGMFRRAGHRGGPFIESDAAW
jgi:hypothetical protein